MELFKKTKVGSLEQLTNSTDSQVAECAREQRTGKWSTTKTLQNAESRLATKKVVGVVRGLSSPILG